MPDSQEYLRFDIGSIDSLVKSKLEKDFPDVSQRGSSSAILSEAIASTFSLLMYQLNRTATNGSFVKTNSVESIINHTKLLGYNPVGHQASVVFTDIILAKTLDTINYTIPRYSYIETSNGRYSVAEDLTFSNTFAHEDTVFSNVIFKGGTYVEHPVIYGTGEANQKYVIQRGNNIIDHNSIDVYVRPQEGSWKKYEQVDSLFLSEGTDTHYELRYNDRGTYDIFFGDDINGVAIPDNAEIAIYYLAINSRNAPLSVGSVNSPMARFSSNRINSILLDTGDVTNSVYLNELKTVFTAENTSVSTPKTDPETVAEIRRNAPSTFKAQNRLVTKEDYRSFVLNNFSDFVSDVLVLNNEEYLDNYIKYYSNLGLNKPFEESRALFNQINYSGSVNFNNVYLFLIPKTGNYVTNVQKQLIVNKMKATKTLSAEIVPSDSIIINFGVATPVDAIIFEDLDSSGLVITKTPNTNRSESNIKLEIVDVIKNYFDERSLLFDQTIDTSEINSKILSINGVQEISTINGSVINSGLGLYEWNPAFPERITSAPPTNLFTGIFVPRLVVGNLLNKIIFR